MDVVDTLDRPKVDTRGLPEGFDPHYLYEYRIQTLAKSATGLESFLYKYIPISLVKSFAFAIDPTSRFKVSPHSITAVNRTRYRGTASVLQQRFYRNIGEQQSWAPQPNYRGVSNCWDPSQTYGPVNRTDFTGGLNPQVVLPDVIKDTTSRTRLMGSEQGELEFFKSYINSPPREVRSAVLDTGIYDPGTYPPTDPCIVLAHGDAYRRDGGREERSASIFPTGSILSLGVYNALVAQEINRAKAYSQKHCLSLLLGVNPAKRDYTLFRNIVELRDYNRSVASLKQTLTNLRALYVSLSKSPSLRKIVFDLKKTSKDIPNEYLSYHFGWKQTWKDLNDLLAAPAKISKRVNFLIERSGKPTTLRGLRKSEFLETDVSGFDYEITGLEYNNTIKSSLKGSVETRIVVNTKFDFPKANIPSFRNEDFLFRIGAIPSVTDVYNLVPWTWLVDWFTGFGNYLELIEAINNDSSLINWGMITTKITGELTTTLQSHTDTYQRYNGFPTVPPSTHTERTYIHSSTLNYECQTRNDVATILDVKLTSVPSSLTNFQKSILGALLAQRTQHSRGDTFRVRS